MVLSRQSCYLTVLLCPSILSRQSPLWNTLRPDNNRVRPALICPQIFIFQQMRLSSQLAQLDKAVGWQWQWIMWDELYISPRTSQNWVVTTIKSSPVAFTPSTIMAITWHLEPSHYTATLTPISLRQTQVINNKSMIHFQKFSEWMRIWLIIPALACWLAFLGEINFILSRVGWDASYIVLQSYIGGYLFFKIIIY